MRLYWCLMAAACSAAATLVWAAPKGTASSTPLLDRIASVAMLRYEVATPGSVSEALGTTLAVTGRHPVGSSAEIYSGTIDGQYEIFLVMDRVEHAVGLTFPSSVCFQDVESPLREAGWKRDALTRQDRPDIFKALTVIPDKIARYSRLGDEAAIRADPRSGCLKGITFLFRPTSGSR